MENGIFFYNYKLRKLSKNILNDKDELNIHLKRNVKTRLNDGRCDRNGNFIVGGMVEDFWDGMELDDPYLLNLAKFLYRLNTKESSGIWRINGNNLTCDKIISNIFLTNSICFSLNGKQMYYTDTLKALAGQPKIRRIDYDSNNSVHCDTFGYLGTPKNDAFTLKCHSPDGSCIDNDDYIWNANCTQGKVVRYDKQGSLNMIVNVPERNVTCMTFGGKDLDVMFITTLNELTLRKDVRTEEDKKNPKQGYMYSVKIPNVKGVKEARFNGDCKKYFV